MHLDTAQFINTCHSHGDCILFFVTFFLLVASSMGMRTSYLRATSAHVGVTPHASGMTKTVQARLSFRCSNTVRYLLETTYGKHSFNEGVLKVLMWCCGCSWWRSRRKSRQSDHSSLSTTFSLTMMMCHQTTTRRAAWRSRSQCRLVQLWSLR
jgi:hypothetical protein